MRPSSPNCRTWVIKRPEQFSIQHQQLTQEAFVFKQRPPFEKVVAGWQNRPWVIGVAAGLIVMLSILLSVLSVRFTAHGVLDAELKANLTRMASVMAATIGAEAHASLTQAEQEETHQYASLNEPLSKAVAEIPGIKHVYTLREVGQQVRFVLDGTPVGDADGDGIEDHSFLMEVYEDPDPAALRALREGMVTVSHKPFSDRWGTFLGAYAPIHRADGTVDGVVGIDVDASEYRSRLARVDLATIWAVVPGGILSVIAGILASWFTAVHKRHALLVESHRIDAEQANRAKSVLLANVSHELRTPMTAIMGFGAIAADQQVSSSERAEALTTVRHNAEHLMILIGDLLDMSRIEAAAMRLEVLEVDLRNLITSAVVPLRLRAQEKSIALEVIGEDRLPESAMLDPTRTRQILLNLLSNAVKFTERGTVRLRLDCTHGFLVFSVEDTGPGMNSEQVGRLFTPFSQVGGSASKRREGTGLGLAISRHLAELMDGSISVQSQPGIGSVFTVQLPYKSVDTSRSEGHARDQSARATPLVGYRVLVAEDGLDNMRLLRLFLTAAGAEVIEHADGQSALLALVTEGVHADLVLTDWNMPVLDGAGLVKGLRDAKWNGPVISLTASATDEQHRECLNTGCDAHLTKPIERGRLIQTCVHLLRKSENATHAA